LFCIAGIDLRHFSAGHWSEITPVVAFGWQLGKVFFSFKYFVVILGQGGTTVEL